LYAVADLSFNRADLGSPTGSGQSGDYAAGFPDLAEFTMNPARTAALASGDPALAVFTDLSRHHVALTPPAVAAGDHTGGVVVNDVVEVRTRESIEDKDTCRGCQHRAPDQRIGLRELLIEISSSCYQRFYPLALFARPNVFVP
jgi:hypothetical protein